MAVVSVLYEILTNLQSPELMEYRVATFSTRIGHDGLRIYNSLQFEENAHKRDMDKIIEKIEQYCLGETNVLDERYNYKFNKISQQQSETFDEYFSNLSVLVETCQFADMQNDLLRDRIVIGIRDDCLDKQLLQKKDLSFRECIDTCRAYESTSEQMRNMKMKNVTVHSLGARRRRLNAPRETRHAKLKRARYQPQQRKCKYCGKDHQQARSLASGVGGA